MSRAAGLVSTLLLLASWGCTPGDAPEGGAHPVSVDSAGIRITTSAAAAWPPDAAWRLSDAPVLTIGVVDGPPAEQLFQVVDAGLLSDGRILVANAGTSELRVFDREGRHLRSMGGEGEGPGEFTRMSKLDVDGDSAFVWDRDLRRLSVFSPDAGFVRSVQLAPASDRDLPRYLGRFADGTLLADITVLVEAAEIVDGAIRDRPMLYMHYARDGSPLDTLGTFPGPRSIISLLGPTPASGIDVRTVAFDPMTRVAIDGGHLWEGDGTAFELRRMTPDGTVESIIRRRSDPGVVTADLLERLFEEQNPTRAEYDEDYLERIRKAYAAMPVGGKVPAFDRLEVGSTGELWARHYDLPGAEARVWSVFSPDGAWLGEVPTPAGLEVYEIGRDVVLGKELDELEVEHVVLYGIVRAPGSG